MTVKNSGKLSAGKYIAKAGTMGITNEGTIENGTYTARGDLTYTDTATASLKDGTLISEEGKADITALGVLLLKKLTAKENVTVNADRDVTLTEAEAGDTLAISSGGSVKAETLKAETGDASVIAKKDATIGTLTAEAGGATIEATDGALNVGTLSAKKHADLTSGSNMTLHTAEVGGTLAISSGGSVKAETLKAETGDASVIAKTDAKIGKLTAEAGGATVKATNGALDVETLSAKKHAELVSGGAMTLESASVGSLTAKAGTTLAMTTLHAGGNANLTSGGDMTLDTAEAGTLAISSGGSVNAGTLTAKTGDASVTAKTDAKIGTLTAEAGGATIEATDGALNVGTLSAKKKADLASGSDMVLDTAEVGGTFTAEAGGSISVKGTDAKISAADITMHAREDIRITDRSPVGKLDGVDTSQPAGQAAGSGAAGSLVTGEAKPHDFDASGKGSALLSSADGRVTLSAKKVEIDTLANGNGSTADLTISADNIGIDDLTGTGEQHVTIHGKDGQSQSHYAGIHSTAEGGTLVKDSAIEHLELTGREPLGLSNTAIGGDSLLATDKIRVTIQKNPKSSQAEHFGNLSLNGYDIATDHVMTSVKDGLTVNGERFPMTAESVMNASLYEDRTLGRDGREKEEEAKKDSPSLSFSEPNEKESYEVVK